MDPRITILVAVIAASPGLIALILQRRKDQAAIKQTETESAGTISTAALALIKPYQDELAKKTGDMEKLHMQVDALEKRVSELERKLKSSEDCLEDVEVGAWKLVHQIISLGAVPVYEPPERRLADE